jgi:hypothetical protein
VLPLAVVAGLVVTVEIHHLTVKLPLVEVVVL